MAPSVFSIGQNDVGNPFLQLRTTVDLVFTISTDQKCVPFNPLCDFGQSHGAQSDEQGGLGFCP